MPGNVGKADFSIPVPIFWIPWSWWLLLPSMSEPGGDCDWQQCQKDILRKGFGYNFAFLNLVCWKFLHIRFRCFPWTLNRCQFFNSRPNYSGPACCNLIDLLQRNATSLSSHLAGMRNPMLTRGPLQLLMLRWDKEVGPVEICKEKNVDLLNLNYHRKNESTCDPEE